VIPVNQDMDSFADPGDAHDDEQLGEENGLTPML
jgi:hypothetical protein